MARRSKSSQTNKEEVRRTASGLKHPYPGKPGEGKYVIYVDTQKEGEEHPRVLVLIFKEIYAAHRFIQVLIAKDEYEECPPVGSRSGILTSSGVRITAFHNRVAEVLHYEPTEAEAEWRDEQMETSALRLKLGTKWEGAKHEELEEQVEDEATGEVKTVKVKQGKKAKAPKPEKKPKVDKTGMVTAGDLATRLGIEPRIFRGSLRALKKVKPEGGWLWSKNDAEAIFKEVSKQLEKDGKVKKGKKK